MFGTVVFALMTSVRCWFGYTVADGGVYVNVVFPVASVTPEAGAIVPNTKVVSMRTVYPGTPVPAASVKAAVIVAVPVGAMTGVGVLSLKVEMGAGGATVTSITLPFVPVRDPFVATTDAITLP